jgi:hypothetical protein
LLNELFGFECSRRSHFLLQEVYVLVTFAVAKVDLQEPAADEAAAEQDYGDYKVVADESSTFAPASILDFRFAIDSSMTSPILPPSPIQLNNYCRIVSSI